MQPTRQSGPRQSLHLATGALLRAATPIRLAALELPEFTQEVREWARPEPGPRDAIGLLSRRIGPARQMLEARVRRTASATVWRGWERGRLRRAIPGGAAYVNVGHSNLSETTLAEIGAAARIGFGPGPDDFSWTPAERPPGQAASLAGTRERVSRGLATETRASTPLAEGERLDPNLDFVPNPDVVISGSRELELMEAQRLKEGRFVG